MNASADELCKQFHKYLKDDLAGVVLCGSASYPERNPSDIDCVIIVNKLTTTVSIELSRASDEIEKKLGIPCSTTIITVADLERLNDNFLKMDGKAVQCLIEANDETTCLIRQGLIIQTLSEDKIKKYSYQNYWILRALLVKTLTRSKSPMTSAQRLKICKIALITAKMASQYTGDALTEITGALNAAKKGVSELSDEQLHSLIIRCSNLLPR